MLHKTCVQEKARKASDCAVGVQAGKQRFFEPSIPSETVNKRGLISSSLLLDFLKVELKLFAFKDVAIAASRLTGAGRNAREQLSGSELVDQLLVSAQRFLALVDLLLVFLAMLDLGAGLIGLLNLLLVQLNVIVLEIPLTERSGIDLDNGVLDEGLGTDQLIVRRVVKNVNYAGFVTLRFGAPREVSVVELECTVLHVLATASDKDDALLTDFGAARHSSHFELSLLLVDRHPASSRSPLLSGVPRDTHSNF